MYCINRWNAPSGLNDELNWHNCEVWWCYWILCVRIRTIWIRIRICGEMCDVLSSDVMSCDMMWYDVLDDTPYMLYLWISINIYRECEWARAQFFPLVCYQASYFQTLLLKFVMPFNVHLFIIYGHIIGMFVCVYSWWLIRFALLIGSYVCFF